MELKQMICPSCTGAVQVPTNMDRIACVYCGSELIVEYSEGDMMTLSLAQKIKETLQDVGQETQGAIRENTGVTKTELQRLQIGQQIGTLQIQLSSIRAEIRTLEREKQLSRTAKSQLKELRKEEQACMLQIRNLQSLLSDEKVTQQVSKSESSKTKSSSMSSPMKKGCAWGCVWGCATYIGVALVLSIVAIPLDKLFFNISTNDDVNGPFISIAAFVSFFFGVAVFFYFLFPDAGIWKRLPFRIPFDKSEKSTNG